MWFLRGVGLGLCQAAAGHGRQAAAGGSAAWGPTMATLIQAVDSRPQRTLSVASAMAAGQPSSPVAVVCPPGELPVASETDRYVRP